MKFHHTILYSSADLSKFIFTSTQSGIVQCRRGFWESGDLDKHFIHNTSRKDLLREDFGVFFFLDALKIAFQMRYLTHRWTQLGYSFQKSGNFFIIKRRQARPCYVSWLCGRLIDYIMCCIGERTNRVRSLLLISKMFWQ